MTKGFTQFFPAKIGDSVYAVTETGYIRREVVTGYAIDGDSDAEITVCLRYIDRRRRTYASRTTMESFGRTLFLTENQAVLAIRERHETEGEKHDE